MDDLIEAIESGYEYLLAYAAQGKETDAGGAGGKSEVRSTLESMLSAARAIAEKLGDGDEPFHGVTAEDAVKTSAALSLVLAQDGISSEIVDNLNASIHLRALLTDLFLLSEARHS